ncbi:MAG: hypothetical protein INQ03_03380 [Candidatus Heimdallarchaeota archaeon]|nr:hypothetical protein [Candidatus Heimdallarchaeota archaeon]
MKARNIILSLLIINSLLFLNVFKAETEVTLFPYQSTVILYNAYDSTILVSSNDDEIINLKISKIDPRTNYPVDVWSGDIVISMEIDLEEPGHFFLEFSTEKLCIVKIRDVSFPIIFYVFNGILLLTYVGFLLRERYKIEYYG